MSDTLNTTYDVIVVGGGGSGLAAALSAAQHGARTLLLEKNAAVGGTTGMSIGSITASGTRFQKAKGVIDTPELHFTDMGRFLGPIDDRENKRLRRVLVDHVPDTLEWLRSLGLRFFGPMPEPPHTRPRMHNVLPNSRAYPYVLSRACKAAGVRVETNAPLVELLLAGGRVEGVVTERGGVPTKWRASRGVILATGDFSASPDFKQRYLPQAAHIDAINPTNTGDGQRLGEALGGTLLNGDILWGPSIRFAPSGPRSLMQRLPAWPFLTAIMEFALARLPIGLFRPLIMSFMTTTLAPEPSLLRAGAILVNREGKRFADELSRPEFEIARQTGKAAYIVFDDRVAQSFRQWPNFISTAPGIAYAYLDDYARQKHLYARATTLEALAGKLGVPENALSETVGAHNAALAGGRQGDRAPLGAGPYHAIGPICAWVVITEGGLAVSERHEVIGAGEKVVDGLYAVGSVGQGGLVLAGHGHHLGWAFTSGRRAGRFAAEQAPRATSG